MSSTFPILSERELVQCLNELGMNTSVELLQKPTYEFVHPMFENLVMALVGVTREELQQPVFTAIDALEFPELHDESIPTLAFIKHLTRLMQASGIRDFSLKDLYKPEAPRLRRNLSAVINFAKFREEKLIAYTELQEQLEGLLAEKEVAEAEGAALQAELRRLQEARAAEVPQVAALEEATAAIYAENQALNRQQAALSGEVRALKAAANGLTDEASQLRYRLSQARGQTELLQSQIVHSPQKIQALLEELSGAVERERAALADAERRSRDLGARLDVVGKVEREVQKAIALMEAAEAEVLRKKEASRKVKELRSKIAANEHEALQLGATHQHLRRQQQSLAERLARLEAQAAARRDAVDAGVERQLRDKEAILAENAAAAAKLAENEAAMRSLRERIAELQAAHESQVGAVLEQYQVLRRQVAAYHADVEAAMAPPAAAAAAAAAATALQCARRACGDARRLEALGQLH